MVIQIAVDREAIAAFARRHNIVWLAFFGSVTRDDFSPESDVDVVVRFAPGKTPGFEFFRMQDELTGLMGRRVDLNTPGFLSRYFRDEVIEHAEVLYEQE